MNLALDIGNTHSKIGCFNQSHLMERKVVTDWSVTDLLHYCNQVGVQNVIVSSVAGPVEPFIASLAEHFEVLVLTHDTPLPFENQYTTPLTLGKDRLAAVAGAQTLLPRTNCLVVDCGTCIKYDMLTDAAQYLGGNIAPGAEMRTRAMHEFTARLPQVDLQIPEGFIGKSTLTALQNGAFLGAVLEIDGMIDLFKQQFDSLTVFLTGGDAPFFKPHLKHEALIHEPNLTLHGLNNILNFNHP